MENPLKRRRRLSLQDEGILLGDFVDYSRVPKFAGRPNWRVDVFPTGALPHFELAEEFVRRYDAFLASVDDQ